MDELFMNLTPWVQGALIFSVAATILGAAICATVSSVAKARERARRAETDGGPDQRRRARGDHPTRRSPRDHVASSRVR